MNSPVARSRTLVDFGAIFHKALSYRHILLRFIYQYPFYVILIRMQIANRSVIETVRDMKRDEKTWAFLKKLFWGFDSALIHFIVSNALNALFGYLLHKMYYCAFYGIRKLLRKNPTPKLEDVEGEDVEKIKGFLNNTAQNIGMMGATPQSRTFYEMISGLILSMVIKNQKKSLVNFFIAMLSSVSSATLAYPFLWVSTVSANGGPSLRTFYTIMKGIMAMRRMGGTSFKKMAKQQKRSMMQGLMFLQGMQFKIYELILHNGFAFVTKWLFLTLIFKLILLVEAYLSSGRRRSQTDREEKPSYSTNLIVIGAGFSSVVALFFARYLLTYPMLVRSVRQRVSVPIDGSNFRGFWYRFFYSFFVRSFLPT
eukprot:TRINITY_DN2773_c0_g1_i2.p1 TRINITY_DN2773_c0_g1~~TRINITY_DN2773_c0_g1_i2.p1  ORF type:complete len:368 (+),score=32.83 TRINITY_DN2773_c0_g1_i2:56-1159(+)